MVRPAPTKREAVLRRSRPKTLYAEIMCLKRAAMYPGQNGGKHLSRLRRALLVQLGHQPDSPQGLLLQNTRGT